MNIFQWIHYKLFGFYRDGLIYYINCPKHGLEKAYEHGYDLISCEKCLKEFLSQDL